jgi:hypothetical protein
MNLGKWKFWFDRWMNYVSRVTGLASIATFFIVSGWSWWLLVPMFIGSILFMVFVDIPLIAPKEYEHMAEINPFMQKLMEKK